MLTKKLILVVSPPACGKTYVSKKLAEYLNHVVYLDKDTLIPLSKVVYEVAHEEYNRSSDFFEQYIRNPEYEVTLDLAFEAIQYEDLVLINAPFTREIKDEQYIKELANKAKEHNATLTFVWVSSTPETCHQRMIERNSDRDTWKLEHWDEYVKRINYEIPAPLLNKDTGAELIVFDNNIGTDFDANMKKLVEILQK